LIPRERNWHFLNWKERGWRRNICALRKMFRDGRYPRCARLFNCTFVTFLRQATLLALVLIAVPCTNCNP
jgi:hypothetical protein